MNLCLRLTYAVSHGVGIVVAGIFGALSLVHVYWALGGTVGVNAAIPERPSTRSEGGSVGSLVRAFHPSAAMTLLVAGLLGGVAALVCLRAGIFSPAWTQVSLRWCLAAIALILLARAVGDLKLVGFFKKIRGTHFGVMDTWLYSPLCVLLALGLLSLALPAECRQ